MERAAVRKHLLRNNSKHLTEQIFFYTDRE